MFAVLFWAASLILCTDALLLNMMRNEEKNFGVRGWDMLYYEKLPTTYEILGGEGGHLKVTFNWMMHVIFGFGERFVQANTVDVALPTANSLVVPISVVLSLVLLVEYLQ